MGLKELLGLGSQVSMWLGPPSSHRRMQASALLPAGPPFTGPDCCFEFQNSTEGDPQETQGSRPQDSSTADRAAKVQSLQLVHEYPLIRI